jgi:NAD(P)-dependent dehydrogenase (short-subunit alcohol dehydrogenase family)
MSFDINKIPPQKGRVAIVTGANIGLGYETTRALAQKDITVVMACRTESKALEAKAKIQQEFPNAQLLVLALDLSSLASVREFALTFKKQFDKLDLLINNAGVMIPPYQTTVDGFELQLGTNYLAHFLLTSLLLDTLEKTDGARVVSLASIAHKSGKINFDDLQSQKKYSKMKAYQQSKLACLIFSIELDRRLKANGYKTLSVAAHPGVSTTNLVQYIPSWLITLSMPVFKAISHPPREGAQPQLYAALGDDISGGDYTGPTGFQEMVGPAGKTKGKPHAYDKATAEKLWDASVKLTDAKFFS